MKHCLICEREYDGTQHMGLETCRACSAFYRRCIFSNKVRFVCRRRSNNCNLNTSRKDMCQKCRFDKCKQVGLEVGYGSRTRQTQITKSAASSSSSSVVSTSLQPTSMSPSSSTASSSAAAVALSSSYASTAHSTSTWMSNPIHHTIREIHSDNSCLNRIHNCYQRLCDRRWTMEALLRFNTQPITRIMNNKVYSTCTEAQFNEIVHAQVPSVMDFLSESFLDMYHCTVDEKVELLHSCLCEFWILDVVVRTTKLWISESEPDITNIILITLRYYVDCRNLEQLLERPVTLPEKDVQQIIGITERWFLNNKGMITEIVKQKLYEFEIDALFGFLIFSKKNVFNSLKLQNIAETIQNEVCNDLHNCYMQQDHKNYARKLHDLMILIIRIKALTEKAIEEVHLLNLFTGVKDNGFFNNYIASLNS